jgi:hypothetical protein
MITLRQRAARKGARTRAANAASMKRWLEIDKPAHERTVAIINAYLVSNPLAVRVRFVTHEGGYPRLMHGATTGTLVKVLGTGLSWCVKVDGYKGEPREWHASYWELL